MDQHSTSLWHATTTPAAHDPLRGDLQADVVIVGAGITGITAAILLARRGRNVVVLERERVGGGETGNTTAHLTEAIDARYHYIQRKYGKDDAKLVAEASRTAIEQISSFVSEYAIDCGFRRLPGYLYTETRKDVAELKKEASAARECGIDAEFVEQVPLPFATRGAVVWRNQAQFHPQKYLLALAQRAVEAGVRVFERSVVREIREGDPSVVEADGGTVTAARVLMTTNVPIEGFTPVHTMAAPYRSYAIAFHYEGEHPDGLFWDTADPYHYTRWQETGEGTFMIVGGEDHRVGENEKTEECFARLVAYTRERFGSHPERYRWSGQIIEPHGGLPMIGGDDRVFISTGYSGQGMTFGTVGGMLLADLVSGVENSWAHVFTHRRATPHLTTPEFVTENVHFPKHLVADRLTSHDVEPGDERSIARGEGRILECGGRKAAVYRDDQGTLHAVSPVCTHMKCDVAWNPAERSWDCPCHGSRFRPDGEVLNGPARHPLEAISLSETAQKKG